MNRFLLKEDIIENLSPKTFVKNILCKKGKILQSSVGSKVRQDLRREVLTGPLLKQGKIGEQAVWGTHGKHIADNQTFTSYNTFKCHSSFLEIFPPISHRRFATEALQSSVLEFSQSTMPPLKRRRPLHCLPVTNRRDRSRLADGKDCSKTTQLQCNTFFCFIHRIRLKLFV